MQFSTRYILLFSTALCLISSSMLSIAAVGLRDRQELNKVLDKKKSVLQACRLMKPTDRFSAEEVEAIFQNIEPKVLDLTTGTYAEGVDPKIFDPAKAPIAPAPKNSAQIMNMATQVLVYHVMKEGQLDMLVLPIYGKGLWGTLYGYMAVDADATTVEGITYYDHKETPGLGGEVDNSRWKGLWPGRKVFDEAGQVALKVTKGPAGPVDQDPHRVDGLSGATITSRGVTNMLQFWFGPNGYGPYLEQFRKNGSVQS
ncbi:MAG: Na(+)-translocating NADH-quinone reductase subunit C [Candidatus Hydrogenedentes bacterium]|nr:Na(+)-translocating NADH-quinone reductase subunit C [Candidatus Hydrogenedentota bacterium]